MDQKAVTELLKSAVSAVNASGAKGELREPAFRAALALLTGDARTAQVETDKQQDPPPLASRQAAHGAESGLLDRIASAVNVDAEKLRYVYADKDGEPELIIKSSKLPPSKSASARDIAVLVMGARQGAEIDDYTEAETIRSACKRYGKFDPTNFGKTMASLDNHVITQGKGTSIQRKLTHPGIEEAAELIEKYASQG